MKASSEFHGKVERFVAAVAARTNAREAVDYPNLSKSVFSIDEGSKYMRIVKAGPGGGRSSFCFVDKSTGDILKCESWKKPAKHARGNLDAPDGGLGAVGDHGANYLR